MDEKDLIRKAQKGDAMALISLVYLIVKMVYMLLLVAGVFLMSQGIRSMFWS